VNDDDVLRRALHGPTEPINTYRVLQDLRLPMRRARHRRRVAVGATAVLLLVAGGAGVLAVTSAPGSPATPTTATDDDKGTTASTLPPVSERRDMADTDEPGLQAVPTTVPAPIPIEPPASAPTSEGRPAAPVTAPTPGSTGITPPSAGLPPSTPATTAAPAAPPGPAEPTSQVLTSACGDVGVEFDERTVRITTIAALPGYTSQTATDGPESVEVKFLGAGGTCEVHAQLEQGRLAVEIQNSDDA
jgi:cytoskeletal protein RodZ